MSYDQLQKPPRLLDDKAGAYDWREFDRWLRRVYDLLSVRSDSNAFSVIDELSYIHSIGFSSSTVAQGSAPAIDVDIDTMIHTLGNQDISSHVDESIKSLVFSMPAETVSTTLPQSLESIVFASGGGDHSTIIRNDDSFMTLYWMGVS